MIIHDFDILRVPYHLPKTDVPLVVDSHPHLARSLSFQQFRTISRRVTEVLDRRSGIQLAQLAERPNLYFAGELSASDREVERLCAADSRALRVWFRRA